MVPIKEFLPQIKIDAGLTQAELASLMQWPQTFVSKSELSQRRIDLLEFVEACGLTVEGFLTLLDEKLEKAAA